MGIKSAGFKVASDVVNRVAVLLMDIQKSCDLKKAHLNSLSQLDICIHN